MGLLDRDEARGLFFLFFFFLFLGLLLEILNSFQQNRPPLTFTPTRTPQPPSPAGHSGSGPPVRTN